ncbi:MAG: NYN domain-containing protein [Lachnospira sp.]|nr:NYN domain-containing protein [Lachnospira sp.]
MRIDTKDLVTTVAYMIGVKKDNIIKYYEEECRELLDKLFKSKEATIIRYLSKLRTTLFLRYKKTDSELRFNITNLDKIEWYDKDNIKQLQEWGIPVLQPNYTSDMYMEHFANLIAENIDACEHLFEDWIKFEYIKDLFVIPRQGKKNVLKAEFETFMKFYKFYPFQMYIHWSPRDCGNILYNDEKFVGVLYGQHGELFTDTSKVKDATDETKDNIYEFINSGHKVAIAVDCENSDVFKLYGVLKNLNQEELDKIEKIMLFDDSHTSTAWEWLGKFTKIPVEYIQVQRVTDAKSLVDIQMTAGVCTAYYKDNIDSFIVCSSDSDFWGLISSLPDANFLVMYEYTKCGKAIKEAMAEKGVVNCSVDDFCTGNATELKRAVLLDQLESYGNKLVGMNGKDLARQVYVDTRITYVEADVENFYNKYVKSIRLKMDEEGVFRIEIAR